ncbi:MAG: signal peptidase I [Eubacteriales bacterium]|nr:signal peptidase I [Eubacteriales bacterium]
MSETEHTEKKQSDRWFPIFCAVMIVLLLLNTFVVKLAVVDGSSMYPTLHDGQFLLVFRPGYKAAQGDVVVIHTGEGVFNRDYIVKRVIAIEGQTVKIDYDLNEVSVEDVILSEPYLNFEEDPMLPRDDRSVVRYTVPEGCVFVMGDNRNHSADSRSDKYGMIDVSKIVGRVVLPVL